MFFYEIFGRIAFFGLVLLFFVILLSFVLGVILIKKHRIIFPKILLLGADTFYYQMQSLAAFFGLNRRIIDQIGIDVRNNIYAAEFEKVKPVDRILVLPQCLRSVKCPARLDPMTGIQCKGCGLCVIKDIKKEAERLGGYRVYTVPGGRFVERIVKEIKPRAAIGVACVKDLNTAMRDLARSGFIVQGVPLLKDGCVTTQVDLDVLYEKMRLGLCFSCKSPAAPQETGIDKKAAKGECADDSVLA